MKNRLKIWLIIWASLLVVWWTWAWLTKVWIIPNWFDIELLYFYSSDIYGKCIDCGWKILDWCNLSVEYDGGRCCEWTYSRNCNRRQYWEKDWKPIIYFYPTTETEVNVKLWTPENLTHTYPKYNSEKWWNVIAQPNWDLEDMDTWRKLYALYREWKSDNETNFDEWFVVAWKDIIPFLEEKLAILWLNEREAEEFIVYWLPQMEDNAYNLIRFETKAEQDENMSLNITPNPDTVIRVMMDWKAIDEPIDIPEQQLESPERNGFTVVERWWSPRN